MSQFQENGDGAIRQGEEKVMRMTKHIPTTKSRQYFQSISLSYGNIAISRQISGLDANAIFAMES